MGPRTLALTADLKTLNALASEMSSNLTQVTTMAEQSSANIFDLEFDKVEINDRLDRLFELSDSHASRAAHAETEAGRDQRALPHFIWLGGQNL